MYQLTEQQKLNARSITKALEKKGLTNSLYHAAVLGVVYKESGIMPRTEKGYANTSVSRIRQVFPVKLRNYTDAQLETLKKSDVDFFDLIYGKMYGNDQPGDGYRFRGRGYNQLTFKDNYKAYVTDAGIDIVADPDKVNEPSVAANVLAGFKKKTLLPKYLKNDFNLDNLNDVATLKDAVRIAMRQTAGWRTNTETDFFKANEKKAFDFAQWIANNANVL